MALFTDGNVFHHLIPNYANYKRKTEKDFHVQHEGESSQFVHTTIVNK